LLGFKDVVFCYFLKLYAQKVGFFHHFCIYVEFLAEMITS